MAVRIALIHAVRVAMEPVEHAFRAHWPQAERYTCSSFGDAIDAVKRKRRIPVLKPNEAMFAEALKRGSRLGMLATFLPSVSSMEAELLQLNPKAKIKTICIPEAMAALNAGDGETHDRLLAAAAPQLGDCDVIMLAQFSTARAKDVVSKAVKCAILSSPESAVLRMKELA